MVPESEKRNIIKKAARELFFRFGFSKTAMEDIARQSGLAKPTLYYYYANKEAIFDEVVLEEAREFMDGIEKRLPVTGSAASRIAKFFTMLYEGLKYHALSLDDMPDHLCEHSPHGHPIVEKLNALFSEKLIPLLAEGKQSGELVIKDIETTAHTIVFMTEFLNFDWLRYYPAAQRDKVVKNMTNLILNGLKRRDDS